MHKKLKTENIIKVSGEEIILEKSDGNILVTLSDKLDFYDIAKMNIDVSKDTSLFIVYATRQDIKLDISITVSKNVTFHLYELRKNSFYKVQEKFFVYDHADVVVEKYDDALDLRELNIAYLNGIEAKFSMQQVGVMTKKTKLDLLVYHNFPKTQSNLKNHFVTLKDGTINLNVTAMVYKNMKGCIVSQDNHIINCNDKESLIKPNLLIEEYDIEANHSANIEPFHQDMLFYMQTRGMKEKDAIRLLLRGFLKSNVIDIDAIIKKYWR